jgi:putative transposase
MASSHRVHFFHIIWSTKARKNFILPKIQNKLYPYIGGVIRNSKGSLLEIGGIANHIHLLIEVSNLDGFTALIRNTKASSTSWLKKEFPECNTFSWQDGYGSFSVSYSQLIRAREYIKNQEIHHQNQSFEEEYIKLLDAHHIQYDPRYIFD